MAFGNKMSASGCAKFAELVAEVRAKNEFKTISELLQNFDVRNVKNCSEQRRSIRDILSACLPGHNPAANLWQIFHVETL